MAEAPDDQLDERATAIIERAQEILAHPPTEEERAAAERLRANALIEAAAERARASPVRKVTEQVVVAPKTRFVVGEADLARKRELEAKTDITDAERREWWAIRCMEVEAEVREYVHARRFSRAITVVMSELAAVSLIHTAQRRKLEDRVAALEAAAVKPRVRIAAGSERAA